MYFATELNVIIFIQSHNYRNANLVQQQNGYLTCNIQNLPNLPCLNTLFYRNNLEQITFCDSYTIKTLNNSTLFFVTYFSTQKYTSMTVIGVASVSLSFRMNDFLLLRLWLLSRCIEFLIEPITTVLCPTSCF